MALAAFEKQSRPSLHLRDAGTPARPVSALGKPASARSPAQPQTNLTGAQGCLGRPPFLPEAAGKPARRGGLNLSPWPRWSSFHDEISSAFLPHCSGWFSWILTSSLCDSYVKENQQKQRRNRQRRPGFRVPPRSRVWG